MINSNLRRRIWQILMRLSSIIPMRKGVSGNNLFRRYESLLSIAGKTSCVQDNDLSIIARIVESYRHAARLQENRGNSMWHIFFNKYHIPLHKIFMEGQLEEIAGILRNPGGSELFYGFDNLMSSFQSQIEGDSNSAKQHAAICLDGLVRVAEAMGAIRLDNPERYHVDPPTPWEADFIVEKIEQKLERTISFPNPYPNEHGFWTSKGIVSDRVCQAIYQSWRIKQLLKGIQRPTCFSRLVLAEGSNSSQLKCPSRTWNRGLYNYLIFRSTLLSSGHVLSAFIR